MNFKDNDYWDQPSAYRLASGLIQFINSNVKKYAWQASIDFNEE